MLEAGRVIYYAGSGVCRIESVTEMAPAGVVRKYYVLSLLQKPESVFYVPCDNADLVARMVPLLKKSEILAALGAARDAEPVWERDYRRRSEAFRRALVSTDRTDLLLLIKAVYRHRAELAEGGKALHTTDDYLLRDAENLLYTEISEVLREPFEQVAVTVRETIL